MIHAPKYAIGSTFPSPVSIDTHQSKNEQLLTLPVRNDTKQVELQIRSSDYRNTVLAGVVGFTALTPAKWLIALLLGFARDSVRKLIVKVARRIARRPT